MKSREEVEKLKSAWINDSWDDLETTEDFGEYFAELIRFRRKTEMLRKAWKEQRHDRLASYHCPMRFPALRSDGFVSANCVVEKCAWWDSNFEKCLMILPAYFESCNKARLER